MEYSLPLPETVLEIHDIVIDGFGGLSGVLHPAKIDAALSRPKHHLAYNDNCDIDYVCAVILESFATYHIFADGNKRTALLTMAMCYRLNKVDVDYTSILTNRALEELVLDIADHEDERPRLSINAIRARLKDILSG